MTETVLVTPMGERYHNSRFCVPHREVEETNRETATASGLTPCERCYDG